jgi:hypothetical protein
MVICRELSGEMHQFAVELCVRWVCPHAWPKWIYEWGGTGKSWCVIES